MHKNFYWGFNYAELAIGQKICSEGEFFPTLIPTDWLASGLLLI